MNYIQYKFWWALYEILYVVSMFVFRQAAKHGRLFQKESND